MLGEAKPYFTLIAQSANLAEVEAAAAVYEKAHYGVKVVIDRYRDYLEQTEDIGLWRARVWITIKRSWWQRLRYTLGR